MCLLWHKRELWSRKGSFGRGEVSVREAQAATPAASRHAANAPAIFIDAAADERLAKSLGLR